jgi:hypothetical protein
MPPLHALPLFALAACVSGGTGGLAPGPASSHYLTDDEIAAIPNVFPTTFVPPAHAAFQPMYERMVELENPTVIGKLVSTLISLGDLRVPISVEECGEVDAHYVPSTQTIKICYEFIANANRLAGKPEAEWFTLDRNAAAVLAFTALHEMGHALIDVLDLPIRGREEDAADQFAFLMLTNAGDADLVNRIMVAPAVFFHHHGVEQDRTGGPSAVDVHSPSAERAFEAVCLLYGRHRDPDLGVALDDQAAGCITHAAEIVDRWNAYLVAYTRLDNGRTFSVAP